MPEWAVKIFSAWLQFEKAPADRRCPATWRWISSSGPLTTRWPRSRMAMNAQLSQLGEDVELSRMVLPIARSSRNSSHFHPCAWIEAEAGSSNNRTCGS